MEQNFWMKESMYLMGMKIIRRLKVPNYTNAMAIIIFLHLPVVLQLAGKPYFGQKTYSDLTKIKSFYIKEIRRLMAHIKVVGLIQKQENLGFFIFRIRGLM